ncbi:MAG: acyloxyacyl hydrolase [Pseudomonadota bacterium]
MHRHRIAIDLPLRSHVRAHALRHVLAAVVLLVATAAQAREEPRRGLALAAGNGALGQRHDSLRVSGQQHWARTWGLGAFGQLGGYWDLGLTLWDASDLTPGPMDDGASRIVALGLGPVLRWELPALAKGRIRPFAELGVGFALLSDNELRSGKQRELPLGSHWQFEDRGVLGVRLGAQGRLEIAYQRMHHSNLNFASSNHGVDSHLVLIGYRW